MMQGKLMAIVGIGAMAGVTLASQQVGQTVPALTALDYAEIQQLYARYAFGHDTGADDGGMFARTFTEDGVLDFTNPPSGQSIPVHGYAELEAFGRSLAAALDAPYHYATNILIEPTENGVIGAVYVMTVGEADEGVRVTGVFHDQLAKTPDGWRFKQRTFTYGDISDELVQALR